MFAHERIAARLSLLATLICLAQTGALAQVRSHALGVASGVFEPGPYNAITDVAGVRVGHVTVIEGDSVRTGVTAIFPPAGNACLDRVPAADGNDDFIARGNSGGGPAGPRARVARARRDSAALSWLG